MAADVDRLFVVLRWTVKRRLLLGLLTDEQYAQANADLDELWGVRGSTTGRFALQLFSWYFVVRRAITRCARWVGFHA